MPAMAVPIGDHADGAGLPSAASGLPCAHMKSQTYANHRAMPPLPFVLAGVAILTWAGFNLWQAVRAPSCGAWLAGVGSAGLVVLWFYARHNSQIMQDRIIRLEMQVRLARLMPGRDLAALTMPQLIGLRFASDQELPTLIERTLKGELRTADQIKRAITDWQADWMRV